MSGRREPGEGTSLLVRNISKSVRAEELRYAAEKYGRVRDVYIPKDYYTGESRGLGFVEFADPRDADDAIDGMDRLLFDGKEISVVAARQGRKRPDDFRHPHYGGRYDRGRSSGGGGGGGYDRGYDRGGSSRGYDRDDRSRRSGRDDRDYDRGREDDRGGSRRYRDESRSPRRRSYSRSYSRSRSRSPAPADNKDRDRSRSRAPEDAGPEQPLPEQPIPEQPLPVERAD